MPSLFKVLSIVFVVYEVLFSSYVPKESYSFMVYVVAILIPSVFLTIGFGKLWRVIKRIHPVISLAVVILMGVLVVMADQPFSDSIPYLGVIVILILPMLVISLCMNFHDS